MENEQAIEILQDELKHTQIHLRDRGKAPEFYEELGNLCKAYEMAINALEQPQGEWIYHKGLSEHRECSNCGVWLDWDLVRNSYCPNCGAKMKQG